MEFTLTEQNAVPLIVLSTARDPVEQINSILRKAGHPVHCTWIPSLRDLGDALAQINPELLLIVDGGEDLGNAATVRDQLAASVPLIVVAEHFDENRVAVCMAQGARDVVVADEPGSPAGGDDS